MQNRPSSDYEVRYEPFGLTRPFPVVFPDRATYSPPAEPVSYLHYHDCLELGYCYEGCGIFFIDGQVLSFSARDASIIGPGQLHIAQSNRERPSQWKFVSLDPFQLLHDLGLNEIEDLSRTIGGLQAGPQVVGGQDANGLAVLIGEIIEELEEKREHFRPMVKALVYQLLLKLSRVRGEADPPAKAPKSGDPLHTQREKGALHNPSRHLLRISPALTYISEHYASRLAIDQLAGICQMSPTVFRRYFKQAMGVPPSDYLHLVRIRMASSLLLHTSESVLEVSLKVGYPTLSSFNRQFIRILGVPPRRWRRDGSAGECEQEPAEEEV